MFIAN